MSEAVLTPARGMTVEAAAAYLTMSPSFVRKAIYRGLLPARKLGVRTIVLREDLDRMLEEAPRA